MLVTLGRITVTKIQIYFRKNGSRNYKNRLKKEKFVALRECFKKILHELVTCIYLSYQTNGNHAMELQIVGQIISEWHWKSTFNFRKL